MQLNTAKIENATGGVATILLQVGAVLQPGVPAGASVDIASGLVSQPQTGRLLTVLVARPAMGTVAAVRLSFNLDQQLPATTATAAGSPYRLSLVQGGTALRQTWTLVIANAAGEIGRIAGTVA